MFKQLYSLALIKFLVMIIFTILLNILCETKLGIVSWLIVFVPFIFMTIISSTLLYAFGVNIASNNSIHKSKNESEELIE
jgi:hypothetical protein